MKFPLPLLILAASLSYADELAELYGLEEEEIPTSFETKWDLSVGVGGAIADSVAPFAYQSLSRVLFGNTDASYCDVSIGARQWNADPGYYGVAGISCQLAAGIFRIGAEPWLALSDTLYMGVDIPLTLTSSLWDGAWWKAAVRPRWDSQDGISAGLGLDVGHSWFGNNWATGPTLSLWSEYQNSSSSMSGRRGRMSVLNSTTSLGQEAHGQWWLGIFPNPHLELDVNAGYALSSEEGFSGLEASLGASWHW